jgi:pimeloyl-ACP methyl ester carboxylesterase
MMQKTNSRQALMVDGIRISAYSVGEGAPVLVLHGWGVDSTAMQPLADGLAKRGFRVYALDAPGFGASDSPPTAWSVFDYARFMIAFLDTYNLDSVFVIGHSFGGRLGLILGSDYASRVRKMTLIDSAGVPPRRSLSSQIRLTTYRFIRDRLNSVGAKQLSQRLQTAYAQRYGSADYKSAGVLRETFVKIVNQDLRAHAARVRVPTLLLWGEHDDDTPLWQAKILENLIPDAGLVTFPGAGHYSYLEHLHETIHIIEHFFTHD